MSEGQEAWLVRHAETAWSTSGKHTGRTDVPLTEEGRRLARDVLRPRLAGHEFALVLTSPLGRARDTAALAGFADRAEPDDDLMEWDYGEYEGITTAEIRKQRPDWYLWRDGCPGGETPEQVGARCDRVIERVLRAGGDVALFAHGHVLRALGARWVQDPPSFGGRLFLETAALSILGFERDVRVLRSWNT
jgi:broad specificity phosphatase PhoE